MKKSVALEALDDRAVAFALVGGLSRLLEALQPQYERDRGAPLLTLRQLQILAAIRPGQTNRDLKELFKTNGSTITRALDSLVLLGLVARARKVGDLRLTTLHCTGAGHTLLARIAKLNDSLFYVSKGRQELLARERARRAATKSAKETAIAPVTAKNERKVAPAKKVRGHDAAAGAIAA